LSSLSDMDRATLLMLCQEEPGGSFDRKSLSRLFAVGLVDIDHYRRVILTDAGKAACDKLQRDGKGKKLQSN